jgi:SAM-dependent methyltransferase
MQLKDDKRTFIGGLAAERRQATAMLAQRLASAPERSRRHQAHARVGGVAPRANAPYASFAEVYDFLIGAPALPLLHATFRRAVRRFHLDFRSLADVGCGTGGFLVALSCGPAALIGVDRSAAMLAIARRRLAPCPVTLLQQDMRCLRLPNPVDLITCHNQTINYLTLPGELQQLFSAVAGNLHRGGALVFDFLARATTMSRMQPARVRETIRLPDHDVRFDGRVDPARGTSTVRIGIARRDAPGRRRVEVHRQRWFSPETIRRCLRASGLRLLRMGPVRGSDPGWLHVVARRA